MYHLGDYLRLLIHRGPRTVFWCGSDILSLKRSMWRFVIPRLKATHYSENGRECFALSELGLAVYRQAMIFADPNKYQVNFQYTEKPTVYISFHLGREDEYGLWTALEAMKEIPDVSFKVFYRNTEESYDEQTDGCQIAVRLNAFDGFSEVLAKSALRGQYQISAIPYPHMEHAVDKESLIKAINKLKLMKEPNYEGAAYWREILTKRVEA
jgi:hypothetical protein